MLLFVLHIVESCLFLILSRFYFFVSLSSFCVLSRCLSVVLAVACRVVVVSLLIVRVVDFPPDTAVYVFSLFLG